MMERLKRIPERLKENGAWNILAGILFTNITNCVATPNIEIMKHISKTVNASSYTLNKCILMVLIMLPIIIYRRDSLEFSTLTRKEWLFIACSGISRGLAALFGGFALYSVNVFDFTVFNAFRPVTVGLMVCCIPGERGSLFDIFPVILSIAGTIFVAQPPMLFENVSFLTSVPPMGAFLATLNTLFLSFNILFCRKLNEISLLLTTFFQAISGIPVCLISMIIEGGYDFELSYSYILQNIMLAILYIFIILSHTKALCYITCLQIAVLDCLKVLLACLLDYIIYSIIPNWLKWIGAGCVITATMIYLLKPNIMQIISSIRQPKEN